MGRITKAATPEQLAAARALVRALPADAYLAGGVAIAATLHHRISRDLNPLLSPPAPNTELAVRVASLEDLACMKLSAISARGMARDFWDLSALLDHGVANGDLKTALALYQRKFAADDVGHVVRSLVYFGDANAAPLPLGLSVAEWERIQRDFERRVADLR